MVTKVRTIDFLPEIFKTKTNAQFLAASLDQLVQQPDFKKIQGYIGSKFGYGISADDRYLVEPSKIRTDYQLEPTVVFKKKDTNTAIDLLTYPGMLDSLKLQGASIDNNTSLFENEFYSWDSFADLDKLINYSQYYWLPTGPEPISVSSTTLYKSLIYDIVDEPTGYKFNSSIVEIDELNPVITLVRGGVYQFVVDQASPFYIQTAPGISGVEKARPNFSTREVAGVSSNGESSGTVIFEVPLADAQNEFILSGDIAVDVATTLSFDQINGVKASDLPPVDGVNIDGKTILFVGAKQGTVGYISKFYGNEFDDQSFDDAQLTEVNKHYYNVTFEGDTNGEKVVRLTEAGLLPDNTKITIRYGDTYIGRNFVKNSYGEIILVPILTASLNKLYYQDGLNPGKYGIIKLVDTPTSLVIDVDEEIIGQTKYTSPNGIKFTNGLKVQFTSTVFPSQYSEGQYYVEGVGTAIELLPVNAFEIPEPFGTPYTTPFDGDPYDAYSYGETLFYPVDQDYITIARNSIDRNGWSRSNRWFHIDVLNTTIANTPTSPISTEALGNPDSRAKRPIIEFYPNLKLFNAGTIAKPNTSFINFTITDAFTQVAGQPVDSFNPDGDESYLYTGATIIFANDSDIEVRNKIWEVSLTSVTGQSEAVITLTVAPDGHVNYDDQTVITQGSSYQGKTVYFNGTEWNIGQSKERVNQPPVFDVYDNSGVSFGDTSFYPSSTFEGCTLFQYAIGTGNDDAILGFPIKYSSVNSLGDITFDVTLNGQTFDYVFDGNASTQKVNAGFVYNFASRTDYTRNIGWQTAVAESFQYQSFSVTYTGIPVAPTFIFDVAAKNQSTTPWPVAVVYVDNSRIDSTAYSMTTGSNTTTITLASTPVKGTKIDVLLYSDQTTKTGYYQLPSNLDHNPFNGELSTINLGDIRGHYKSICNNAPNFVGLAFGPNNYRDLGNVVPYGTRIIQNSASLVNAAMFLRNNDKNFFDALAYNGNEYIKFKSSLLYTLTNNEYSSVETPAYILDDVIEKIADTKIDSNPFFWSDMLPAKNAYITNTYTFKSELNNSKFNLSRIYSFTEANYYGVLVYLTRRVDRAIETTQLIRGVDYEVSTTEKSLIVTTDLVANDIIVIKEYNQTYGSFVPNTPTKLGLYPASLPAVILDSTFVTPTYFLRGHDGSYNKLYGTYEDGVLSDYRDKVLLEFETRIYNNLKISTEVPIGSDEVLPGQFRDVGIDFETYNIIYSLQFLNWVGLNRIDYTSQFYASTNPYTFNYRQSNFIFNNKQIKQGNWRGIYLWLYDTTNPNTMPWEMLGLTTKPTWWDARYGVAPYTSENLFMWQDIANGYIWNNGDPYVNQKRVRDGLLDIIPVDTNGNLKSPFEFLLGSYNSDLFNTNWIVGDMGPAEYSYRKSSSWPFDLMRIIALTKPAKFFSLGKDVDRYKYSTEFNQYLYNGRYSDTITDLVVYGSGTATHSYVNWLVDFLYQFGVDGSTSISELVKNMDVRLSYRLAGFSDKDLLNFYVEKGTTNSKTNSLMIPDDSYTILVYDNEPTDTIIYSSVVVQKTSDGFKVFGNSQNKTYFTSQVPKNNGLYDSITIDRFTISIPRNYYSYTQIIPYGYEFNSLDEVGAFLRGYGLYLNSLGVSFNDIENGLELNWDQMIAETVHWSYTGWDVGASINLNPCARSITINKENSIVQPLTMHQENFVLNQNLIPVAVSDLFINRNGTEFSIKALNEGDSLSLFKANLSTIEHVIVFDNTTVFNDVIYNLITGLRQQRVLVKGTKTAEWNGLVNAAGFILNQDNIENWQENVKYTKGTIVKFKNEYYIANKIVILPSTTFDYTQWDKTSYDDIQKGLLPNPSTRAYEATLFYNSDNPNLENDQDLLSFSLIGFRPRSYLADANLTDATQVNLYKNMIGSKGTVDSVTRLQGINLQQNNLNYDLHENWAIKTGEYGGLLNQNFVEFTLNEALLTGNPSIVSITHGDNVSGSDQQIPLYNLRNYGRPILSSSILPTVDYSYIEKLPSAGYANIDDVIELGYNLDSLSDAAISAVYKNEYIWVADKDNTWQIYTPVSTKATVISVTNNLNGTITVFFDKPHGLYEEQAMGILNFDSRVNGYYLVDFVIDLTSIIVTLTLDTSVTAISGKGLSYLLQSQRVITARDIGSLPLLNAEYTPNKVWVDENVQGKWTVYQKTNNYSSSELGKLGASDSTNFGSAVAYIPNVGYFVSDAEIGKLYHYAKTPNGIYYLRSTIDIGAGYGTAITYAQDLIIVSKPDESISQIFVYKIPPATNINSIVLEQTITIVGGRVGDAMDISGDGTLLYLGAKDDETVIAFQRDKTLTYVSSGITLAEATVVNETYFVCDGNVLDLIKEGERISFLTNYDPLSMTVSSTVNEGDYSFQVSGDQRSKLTHGDKVAFNNTGITSTRLATIAAESYNSGTDKTTFYTVEMFFAGVASGSSVYKVTFSDDASHTVITGTYNATDDTTKFYTIEPIEYSVPSGKYVYFAKINFSISGFVETDVVVAGDKFGFSIATNYDGSKVFVGAPYTNQSETLRDTGTVYYFDRLVENIEVQYDQAPYQFYVVVLAFVPNNQTRVYVNGQLLDTSKYIILLNTIIIGTIGMYAGDIITVGSVQFVLVQQLASLDNLSDLRPGENFGYSLDCNTYGSELIVGSPYDVTNDSMKEGAVYRFTNGGKRFGFAIGTIAANLTEATYMLINGYMVNLFSDAGITTTVTTGSTTVTISPAQAAQLPSYGVITFKDITTSTSRAIAYSSRNATTGVITFSVPYPYATTYAPGNGYIRMPLGSAANIANAINQAGVTNVFSYSTEDGRLVIRLRDVDLGQSNNKLNLSVFNGNYLYMMGLYDYVKSQVIQDPHKQTHTQFGQVVKFNNESSFVVSAPVSNRFIPTLFDYSNDDNVRNDTIFDNNFTTFEDVNDNAGSVYMYDYIPCYDESLQNISNFVYAQSCNDTIQDYGSQPLYGTSLAFNDGVVVVGTPNFKPGTDDGRVLIFTNESGEANWHVYRQPAETVNIDKIQKAQLYDNVTNENLVGLDYIDPLQGKLLGIVAENIDITSAIDPAGYNGPGLTKGSIVWTKNQIGKIWFDVTTTRFLDYHQNDLAYNSEYWGRVFPGSDVKVYTWIESDVTPDLYAGTGTPYDITKYSVILHTDSNNNLIPRYYYWVRNTNTLYSLQGKTLSDTVIERYISDPINSGVAFMAPLQPNTIAIYNSREYINDISTNMHLGFSSGTNDSSGHLAFELIRSEYPDDFLSGFVNVNKGYTEPTGLYDRYLDSFSGTDESGATVPDMTLPKLLQTGVSVRPRQGFFSDRLEALKNYLEYANSILVGYPINESVSATFLYAQGDYYDTTMYWENIYWWADGYTDSTRAALEVPIYSDLLTLTPKEGLIVGVASNSQGKREVYVYTNGDWSRIGLQDGTIKFLSTLWDYQTNKIGFGDNFFDNASFDSYPSIETRYIIRALNEQIYTDTLLPHRNKSLILMFEYIQSENIESQNYIPWLTKTSFTDVNYTVRELTTNQKFQRDNQGILEGYINEVKPYHVVLKDFYLQYTKTDVAYTGMTDFDLPAMYDSTLGRFVTPQLVYNSFGSTPDEFPVGDAIWSSNEYTEWYSNYGLVLGNTPLTIICSVAIYVTSIDQTIYVDNAAGLPVTGVVQLGDELIAYTIVDRTNNSISGLSRGVNDTTSTSHPAGTGVVIDLPGVIVLYSARGYEDIPKVTAYVDTTKYPAPIKAATLKAVMTGDKVVGVQVVDPGQGYVVEPTIVFEPSIEIESELYRINFADNTLLVLTTEFVTGEILYSTGITSNGKTIIPDGYYYINVVEITARAALLSAGTGSIISFYTSYQDAIDGLHRVEFLPDAFISVDYIHKLSMVPRAIANMTGNKVRSITPTLRFDRTSYRAKIAEWTPGEYYSSPYISMGNDASTPVKLYISQPYAGISGTVSPSGGTGAQFTVYNVLMGGNYNVTVSTAGTGYHVNDVITILGDALGGVTTDVRKTGTVQDGDRVVTITDTTGIEVGQYVSAYGIPYGAKVDEIVGTSVYLTKLATYTGTVALLFGDTLPNDCFIHVDSVNGTGGITGVTVTGVAVDANLASLQGAVLPITGMDSSANAVINVTYTLGLKPGQVSGSYMYFYRNHIPYVYDDSLAGGAVIRVSKPRFNPFSIDNAYYIEILNPGTGYEVSDRIIIPGSVFGDASPANDVIITVTGINFFNGAIFTAIVSGNAVGQFERFYVKALSATQLGIYTDAALQVPLPSTSFMWNGEYGTDFAYIPEPITNNFSYTYNTSSVVSYAGYIWQCIDSNNDDSFDPTKWHVLQSDDVTLNALDRIEGYYAPTVGMPGKDAQQLVKGITYPNNVYYGNAFAPEDELPLDFVVRDLPFYPTSINIKASIYNDTTVIVAYDAADYSGVLVQNETGTWNSYVIANVQLGITDISYSNGVYVITTASPRSPIYVSHDGSTWVTNGTLTPFDVLEFGEGGFDSTNISSPAEPLYAVIQRNDIYYAVGSSIIRSTDTAVWEEVFTFGSKLENALCDVTYASIPGFDGFVAVGYGYQIISGGNTATPVIDKVSRVVTSSDGITWQLLQPNVPTTQFNGVASSSSYIVAVGDDSAIWYSTNGSNWVAGSISGSPVTVNINSIAYSGSLFVAVGDKTGSSDTDPGFIITSVNGTTWTQQSSQYITTENLNDVYYSSGYFYAVGENDTILRSTNGINWYDISQIQPDDVSYVVQGNDFLYGYGPEELVAGVVSDTLSMYVNTAPGAYWDLNRVAGYWYKNTGFNMVASVRNPDDINYKVSFADMAVNPARLSVFIVDNTTQLSYRIYEDAYSTETDSMLYPLQARMNYYYSVDWYNHEITLKHYPSDAKLPNNYSLLVEVYEVGNGKELIRSNSKLTPMRVDEYTGTTTFIFDIQYQLLVNEPLVYVNGTKAVLGSDYIITNTNDNFMKLLFLNDTYDTAVDYIVFSILGDSTIAFNPVEYGYSIPETCVFTGVVDNRFTLDTSLISLSGDNENNAIVELNGVRLIPPNVGGTDYHFEGDDLVLILATSANDVLAITTFYDTSRQYLVTSEHTGLVVTAIKFVDKTNPVLEIVFATDPGFASGDLISVSGLIGSNTLNEGEYYVKPVTYSGSSDYHFELYTDSGLTIPVSNTSVDNYAGGGFAWLDADTIQVPYPTIPSPPIGVMPDMTYTDGNRTWVTILHPTDSDLGGRRLNPMNLQFEEDNMLSVLTELDGSETIIITTMVSGASPNSMSFNINVSKTGVGSVYRTNPEDSTWLTQDFTVNDDIMHFANVSHLVENIHRTSTVEDDGTTVYAYVQCDINEVKEVEIYNNDTLETLASTEFGITLFNGKPAIIFSSGVTAGDVITASLTIGNIVEINGERISFEYIDTSANTISGLKRGIQGTRQSATHFKYDMGYGISPARRLTDAEYNSNWNSFNLSVETGDPLQISTTATARFLQSNQINER